MIDKNVAIGIAILIVASLGLLLLSNIGGNVIRIFHPTEKIGNHYFRISNSTNKIIMGVNLNDTQNNGRRR